MGSYPASAMYLQAVVVGLGLVFPAEMELAHLVDHGGDDLGVAAPATVVAGTDADGHRQELAELALGHLLRPNDD